MPQIEYRMFFNNDPATREQLDRVEEITVEQEADMAWEARIQIPICVDESGNWRDEDEDFMRSFSRVRVEIRNGEGPFVPLIDGPIVGYDSQKSSDPGESSITLNVQDDSVYLNREERVSRFENMLDHEIARQIFGEFEQIASTDIEDTPPPSSTLPPVVVQRGTAMQILRSLARRQGMHAYVLPGEGPGQSVGCFKPLPTETGELPPLILLGSERNIETFNVTNNAQRPSAVRASTLRITDKGVITSTSSSSDVELLGEEGAFEESESEPATQILPPYQGESVDLDQAVLAEAQNTSYALEATGNLRGQCYQGVLQPYAVVTVRAGNTRLSGDYLISKVTHTLARSNYTQSFSLKRNARSSVSGTALDNLGGSIF
jgi:hypothetical protein